MMIRYIASVVVSLIFFSACAQQKMIPLPVELTESSALIKHKGLFFTINDSDNEPIVFVFNEEGKIVHQCFIKNVVNYDWEALAYDGGEHLYIGDIGNNLNNRKDLSINKVKMEDILTKDTIEAEKIYFYYPDQKEFPPQKSELHYDAEAMIVKDNEILIFTKNRTVPFDGISKVYSLPTASGKYEAKHLYNLQFPPTHWIEECITDANYFEEELYLLTYSKIYKFVWENDKWTQKEERLHASITQKEGITVDKNWIYITDEDNVNFFKAKKGNYLYRIKR